jgi:hypothetical protein
VTVTIAGTLRPIGIGTFEVEATLESKHNSNIFSTSPLLTCGLEEVPTEIELSPKARRFLGEEEFLAEAVAKLYARIAVRIARVLAPVEPEEMHRVTGYDE